jgi:hypothetical protein
MAKILLTAVTIVGLTIAVTPTAAHAAPGAESITSCVITDGTTTSATYPLNVSDGVEPRTDTVTMVPTPSTGKYVFTEYGFVNKTTGEFVETSSGTGAADNPGYQPPGDPGYYAVTQRFPSYPQYPASEWTFEYRWWAVQGTVGSLTPDKPGTPLCKIAVVLASADGSGSDDTEPLANTGNKLTSTAVLSGLATATFLLFGSFVVRSRGRSRGASS